MVDGLHMNGNNNRLRGGRADRQDIRDVHRYWVTGDKTRRSRIHNNHVGLVLRKGRLDLSTPHRVASQVDGGLPICRKHETRNLSHLASDCTGSVTPAGSHDPYTRRVNAIWHGGWGEATRGELSHIAGLAEHRGASKQFDRGHVDVIGMKVGDEHRRDPGDDVGRRYRQLDQRVPPVVCAVRNRRLGASRSEKGVDQ